MLLETTLSTLSLALVVGAVLLRAWAPWAGARGARLRRLAWGLLGLGVLPALVQTVIASGRAYLALRDPYLEERGAIFTSGVSEAINCFAYAVLVAAVFGVVAALSGLGRRLSP